MAKYLELLRVRSVKKPRKDWPIRWSAAVDAASRKGLLTIPKQEERMIAKEDSPIWKKLAEGAGGFRDATGEGEPPFAFGSEMGWKEVKGKELRVKSDNISETTKNAENTKTLREVSLPPMQVKELISSAIEKVIPKKPFAMTIKFGLIFGFALSIFGDPFPPFDWGSGMGVMDVSKREAIELGLITEEELQSKREELRVAEQNKTLPSMNGNLQAEMPMRHDSPEARKLADIFGDQVKFDGNKVHFQGELMREVFDGKIKKASLGVGYNGDKTSISRALIDDHVVKHVGENETYGGNVPVERGDMDLLPYLWRSPDRVEEGHSGNDVLELDTISGATLTMVVRKGHGPLTIYKYRREHRGANARGLPENGASATT